MCLQNKTNHIHISQECIRLFSKFLKRQQFSITTIPLITTSSPRITKPPPQTTLHLTWATQNIPRGRLSSPSLIGLVAMCLSELVWSIVRWGLVGCGVVVWCKVLWSGPLLRWGLVLCIAWLCDI